MNYVNKWCPSRWIPGWMIDIDLDCHAEPPSRPCNSFTSSQSYYGSPFQNTTQILRFREKCEIKVDARQGVARVIFYDVTELGVLINGYVLGDVVTVP